MSLVKAANASPEDQARLINAAFAARQTSSLIAQPAINAAYAARDVTVMSSRWGPEEIDRVKGISTPSPSSTVNDAYAARDVTVMSSRWGPEEIDRVKGVSTPSPSRTVNDAYAARDVTVMSSRWGSEEIDRVTGTAVTLETPEISSKRDRLVSDLRTEVAGLEAQLKDATSQVMPYLHFTPIPLAFSPLRCHLVVSFLRSPVASRSNRSKNGWKFSKLQLHLR